VTRITPDTNILVRVAVFDDPVQSPRAVDLLDGADLVVITLPALCELAWVLRGGYRRSTAETAQTIRDLLGTENATTDWAAAAAGLEFLDLGGDFADGVIAHLGKENGGEVFASFDRRAVALEGARGGKALLVGG